MNLERIICVSVSDALPSRRKEYEVWIPLYIALLLGNLFNPLQNVEPDSFDRIFGMGLAKNISIDKIILHFFVWFALLAGIFALTRLCLSFLRKRVGESREGEELFAFLRTLSILGVVLTAIEFTHKFTGGASSISLSSTVICALLASAAAYAAIFRRVHVGTTELMWPACLVTSQLPTIILVLDKLAFGPLQRGIALFAIYLLAFGIFRFLQRSGRLDQNGILAAALPLGLVPGAHKLFVEAGNILNQHGIFLPFKRSAYLMLFYALAAGLFFLIYAMYARKARLRRIDWRKLWYPAILVSFALINAMPQLTYGTITTDLFERANISNPINELILFGKIPFIETFSAHMMSDWLFGTLYYWLNHDLVGSFFGLYDRILLIPNLLCLYYLLSKILGRDHAFWIVCLFPVPLSIEWYNIGFLAIAAIMHAVKKNTLPAWLLFMGTIILLCLYKLDIGVAFSVAAFLAVFILHFARRPRVDLGKFFSALAISLGFCLTVYVTVCVIKGVSVMDRMFEFLQIALSNTNWAFGSIGDAEKVQFALTYIFFPLVLLAIMPFAFGHYKRGTINRSQFLIVLCLALAYFANFNRILVRHSLVAGISATRYQNAPLCLAIFVSLLVRKQFRFPAFLLTILVMALFVTGDVGVDKIPADTNLSSSIASFNSANSVRGEFPQQKMTRVEIEDKLASRAESLKKVFDTLLAPSETYLDFTNHTLLYALTGRENPVYVSQSPGLLSGESAQDKFLNEIALHDVPLALLPIESKDLSFLLDGINNSDRYYKVAEYISKNFRPLCMTEEYAIWGAKQKYSEYSEKLFSGPAIQADFLNAAGLAPHDSQVIPGDSSASGALRVKATGSDPYIDGVERLFPAAKARTNNAGALCVVIRLDSDKEGDLQLFYATEKGGAYTESASVSKAIKSGESTVSIWVPGGTMRLRLDIPDHSTVLLKDISLMEYVACDYDYAPFKQAHVHSLGAIPYLWGQYDKKSGFNNEALTTPVPVGNVDGAFSISSKDIDRTDGNFLLLQIQSDREQALKLRFYQQESSPTDGRHDLYSFQFTVFPGEHRYMLRISSDFYWYTGRVDGFLIEQPDQKNSVRISQLSILKGD